MQLIFANILLFNSIIHSSPASDPVLRQYTELPYPDFSEIELKMERMHYSNEDRQVVGMYKSMSFGDLCKKNI